MIDGDEPAATGIDAVIAAFYSAFDNRGGRTPPTAALYDMFDASGRITRVSRDRVESWSVEQFVAPRAELLSNGTLTEFHEWETGGSTTVCGNIASRQSHYRKEGIRDGVAYAGEGRKFIQLYRVDARWVITSVLWEDREQTA